MLKAVMSTGEHAASAALIPTVLEWCDSGEGAKAPAAFESLAKLMAMYQRGSLIYDSAKVLHTHASDAL